MEDSARLARSEFEERSNHDSRHGVPGDDLEVTPGAARPGNNLASTPGGGQAGSTELVAGGGYCGGLLRAACVCVHLCVFTRCDQDHASATLKSGYDAPKVL